MRELVVGIIMALAGTAVGVLVALVIIEIANGLAGLYE